MDITIVKAVFGGLRKTRTAPVYRDDHDLILQLVGVKGLPVHFQAHFANTEYGTAVVMMGSDGEVTIPNSLLATGLPVYCWVIVESGISGRVTYSVQIPVRQKARPDGTITPEQADIISQAISALNDAGANAQEAADSAAQSAEYVAGVKDDLYDAIDRVGVLEEAKETTLEAAGNAEAWAVGNRGGSAVPSTDPAYHNNAKYYAEHAEEAARTLTIDDTLTEEGQAADAKITGDKLDDLNAAINHLAIGKNLIGSDPDVYYPVFIKKGDTLTWLYSDESELPSGSTDNILFYDESKTFIQNFRISLIAGQISRTITWNNNTDAYYVKLQKAYPKCLQMWYGNSTTTYEPYIGGANTIGKRIISVENDLRKCPFNWINGTFYSASPAVVENTKRCRTLINVHSGDIITIDNPSQKYAVGIWKYDESNILVNIRNDNNFKTAMKETITIQNDGVVVIVVAKTDTSEIITPSEVLVIVSWKYNNLKMVADCFEMYGMDWTLKTSDFSNGGFNSSFGYPTYTSNLKRLHNKKPIHVYPNDVIKIKANGQKYSLCTRKFENGTWSVVSYDSSFRTQDMEQVYYGERYITISIAKSNVDADITPEENLVEVTIGTTRKNSQDVYALEKQVNIINAYDFGPLKESGHICCHRGNPYPENTVVGFQKCINDGLRLMEMDLAFTSDNVAVLLHDKTINRIARNSDGTQIENTVNIADITYEQALEYDFGVYKDAQYAGTKIATLLDVMILLKRNNCGAYIDLLGHSYTMEQMAIMHDILAGTRMLNRCALNATIDTLQRYCGMYNDTPVNPSTSFTTVNNVKAVYGVFAGRAPLIICSGYYGEDNQNTDICLEAGKLGIVTMLGTANTKAKVNELFNYGVDHVMSDDIKNLNV